MEHQTARLGRSPGEGNPLFLPREFHNQRSLSGHSPWGNKDVDVTKHCGAIKGTFHEGWA